MTSTNAAIDPAPRPIAATSSGSRRRVRARGPRKPSVRRRPALLSCLLVAYLAIGCASALVHRLA